MNKLQPYIVILRERSKFCVIPLIYYKTGMTTMEKFDFDLALKGLQSGQGFSGKDGILTSLIIFAP